MSVETKIDLKKLYELPTAENTLFYDLETKTTRIGKISFDKNFITLCAKAVAEYIKKNPKVIRHF